jgi:large subunit ribosomal protein L22
MNQDLIAKAKDNTIRVSPLKLANVARSIVNKNANSAVNQLKFSNKRISLNVLKVLNAAIANAENNKQLDIDNLYIKEAYVGKSLSMKRFRPRAKGRASSILKPFSKLTIIVEERSKIHKDKDKDK